MNFIQTPNESRLYQQSIVGDTISGVPVWSLLRLDTGVNVGVGVTQVASTYTIVSISNLEDGVDYELRVLVTCLSGQIVEGAAFINCREAT